MGNDSFNDKENGLAFFTTPAGLRWDAAVFNDAQQNPGTTSPSLNFSWNTFWDVAAVSNGEGWFAEMRIPFSSLRFQNNNGRVVMGIITNLTKKKQPINALMILSMRWD